MRSCYVANQRKADPHREEKYALGHEMREKENRMYTREMTRKQSAQYIEKVTDGAYKRLNMTAMRQSC